MTETTNYKLKKPGYEDYVDIDALNGNADIIDTELKNLNDGKAAARHKHTTMIFPAELCQWVEGAQEKRHCHLEKC